MGINRTNGKTWSSTDNPTGVQETDKVSTWDSFAYINTEQLLALKCRFSLEKNTAPAHSTLSSSFLLTSLNCLRSLCLG